MWKITSQFLVVCVCYWTQPRLLNRLFRSLHFAMLISFFTISHNECICNFINTEFFSFTCLLAYREAYWLHDSRVDNRLKHLLCVYDLKTFEINRLFLETHFISTYVLYIYHTYFVCRTKIFYWTLLERFAFGFRSYDLWTTVNFEMNIVQTK